jgi:FkbM family methyltransferase
MIIDFDANKIDVVNGKRTIRIAKEQSIYIRDIVTSFDWFFDSIVSDSNLMDFSKPAYHTVKGYNHPIHFPSFVEPITETYTLGMLPDMTVLDIGAYSGLTSILFSDIVGKYGHVIAIEPDEENIKSVKINLSNHPADNIVLIEGAAWNHNDGIDFSSEKNMGSSAVSLVGARGTVRRVNTFTLSRISELYKKIDFIKCDAEGGESVIFEDAEFFEKHRPKIVIECHYVDGKLTTEKCVKDLSPYGYKFMEVSQPGIRFPLLFCEAI